MTVEERLVKLERENRWMRRLGGFGVAVVAAVVLGGQGGHTADVVRAREIHVVDAEGRTRILLTSTPAASSEDVSLVLRDADGNERVELWSGDSGSGVRASKGNGLVGLQTIGFGDGAFATVTARGAGTGGFASIGVEGPHAHAVKLLAERDSAYTSIEEPTGQGDASKGAKIRERARLGLLDGKTRLWLRSADDKASATLDVADEVEFSIREGGEPAVLLSTENGGRSLFLWGKENSGAGLTVADDGTKLLLQPKDSDGGIWVAALSGGVRKLQAFRDRSTPGFMLGMSADGVGLAMCDGNGRARTSFALSREGSPTLLLFDGNERTRTSLGVTVTVDKKTGAETKTAENALTMFDAEGNVIWQAPR